MTNKDAIEMVRSLMDIPEYCYWCKYHDGECEVQCTEAFNMAIEALEKTSDKLCARCTHKNKCAIFDNFNIDYCSDWSEEETNEV